MPMRMTPEQYFEAFTLGNYYDFMDDSSNVRKAFNSAVSASHLADCYFNYHNKYQPETIKQYKSLRNFVDNISKRTNNCFQDIRSIANAYKHLYTGLKEKHKQYSTISSAGTIESIEFEEEGIDQLTQEYENSSASTLSVIYTRKTGEIVCYKKSIESVIEFWESMIYNSDERKDPSA